MAYGNDVPGIPVPEEADDATFNLLEKRKRDQPVTEQPTGCAWWMWALVVGVVVSVLIGAFPVAGSMVDAEREAGDVVGQAIEGMNEAPSPGTAERVSAEYSETVDQVSWFYRLVWGGICGAFCFVPAITLIVLSGMTSSKARRAVEA